MVKDFSKVKEHKSIFIKQSNNGYIVIDEKDALLIAITESPKDYEMTQALLDVGANVNMQHGDYFILSKNAPGYASTIALTPLKAAIASKKLGIAKLLLDHNADVEFNSKHSMTPLIMAVDNNYIEGVRLLLSYGADPLKITIFPNSGLLISSLELAIQKGYWDIVDVLLDASVAENASKAN